MLVGLLNTLLVAVTGIITATIIGFIVGIGRLSQQLADRQAVHGLCRSVPQHPAAARHLLLVFRRSRRAAAAARIAGICRSNMFLNNRGLAFPKPIFETGMWAVCIAFLIAVIAAFFIARWAHKRQAATGQPFHTIWVSIGTDRSACRC